MLVNFFVVRKNQEQLRRRERVMSLSERIGGDKQLERWKKNMITVQLVTASWNLNLWSMDASYISVTELFIAQWCFHAIDLVKSIIYLAGSKWIRQNFHLRYWSGTVSVSFYTVRQVNCTKTVDIVGLYACASMLVRLFVFECMCKCVCVCVCVRVCVCAFVLVRVLSVARLIAQWKWQELK